MITNNANFFQLDDNSQIKNLFTFHIYRPEQIIFYYEHQPYGLFILINGVVEIINKKKKKERIVSPAFLGLDAFLNSTEYTVTVKALTKCDINFLSSSAYKQSGLSFEDLKNLYTK